MTPPLLLLDVDGCLQAVVGEGGRHPYGESGDWLRFVAETTSDRPERWPIMANKAVLAAVRELHETGLAEVRWLTTWEAGDDVYPLADQLGLPRFEVEAREREFPGRRGDHERWWKLSVVQRAAEREPGRRIVWVDDDIPFSPRARDWLVGQGDRILAIGPKTSVGLRLAALDGIRAFLEGQTTGVVVSHPHARVRQGTFVRPNCGACDQPLHRHLSYGISAAEILGGDPMDYVTRMRLTAEEIR